MIILMIMMIILMIMMIMIMIRRLVTGSDGVQERCEYKAGVEKKFLRTETSASMKPMLGPVRPCHVLI